MKVLKASMTAVLYQFGISYIKLKEKAVLDRRWKVYAI